LRQGQGLPVVVTFGLQQGSRTQAWCYDAAVVSSAGGATNGPSSGFLSVTVVGQGLGSLGYSGKARVGRGFASEVDMTGGTSCESSIWRSFSGLECKLSAGLGSDYLSRSMPVFVSVGLQSFSSRIYSFSFKLDLLSIGKSNVPATGSIILQILGTGFGLWGTSASIRIERVYPKFFSSGTGTSTAQSAWLSDSSVSSKLSAADTYGSQRTSRNPAFCISVGNQISYRKFTFASESVLLNSSSSVSQNVQLSSGSIYVAIHATQLGTQSKSFPFTRIKASAAETSNWISDSSVDCFASSGVGLAVYVGFGFRDSTSVVASVLSRSTSLSESFSHEAPQIKFVAGLVATTGSNTVLATGVNFGQVSYSTRSSFTSAALITSWNSDTSLSSKAMSVYCGSLYMRATVALQRTKKGSAAFLEVPTSSLSEGAPVFTGSKLMMLIGKNFPGTDISVSSRLGHSSSEVSLWISSSSVSLKAPRVSIAGKNVTVTFGHGCLHEQSLFIALLTIVNGTDATSGAASGSSLMRVLGSMFGSSQVSPSASFRISAFASSFWKSESTILGKVTSGQGNTQFISLTIEMEVTVTATAFVYSVQTSTAFNSSCSSGSTGSTNTLLLGQSFDMKDLTIRSSNRGNYRSSSEMSRWQSDSSILVKQVGRILQIFAISLPKFH